MRKLTLLVLGLFSVLALVACDTQTPVEPAELNALYLDQTTLTLEVGDTYQLEITKDPSDDDSDLTWSSTDLTVAEVSDAGLVTALAKGTATIRVSAENGVSTSMSLTVIDAIENTVTSLPIEFTFDKRPNGLNSAFSGGGFNNIEDGILHMGTVGTGTSQAAIVFDEALKGTTVIETRMKVNSTAFTNAVFLYTAGTTVNDIVVAVAFENNSIKYHSGAGWTNVMSHQMNTWYDIKVVVNIGSRSLNQTKGDFDLYVNQAFIGNFSFRNGGDGFEDNIYALRFGSDKANSDFSYDYIKVDYATKPTLTLTESSKTLTLESNSVDYEVLYTTTGNPEVSITSDSMAGYAVNENLITFTAAGTYVFTVRATTGAGFVERTLTITVEGSIYAPALNILEANKNLLYTEGISYTLLYEVTGGDPVPDVTISVAPLTGVTLDGDVATFTELGTYVFSITAENSVASVTKTITVKVTDSLVLFSEDFENEPDYAVATVGSGQFDYADGQANFMTGSSTGQVFLNIPLDDINNSFVISQQVTVRSNTFSNVMFLYANNGIGTTDIALGVAIENGQLRSHNGSTWSLVSGAPNVLNQTIALKALVNIETGTFELFVDGVSYGVLPFRHPNLKESITHLYLGSDKVNADFSIDDIELSYILAPILELDTLVATVDIDTDPVFDVVYTVTDPLILPTVTITGENKPGYQIDGDLITFTNIGTFEFIVTASNGVYETSETIVITVEGSNFAPIITVGSPEVYIDLELTQNYTLDYEVTTGHPTPTVVITSNQTEGFEISGDDVTFTKAGIYEFIVTASNSVGSDVQMITVTVGDQSYVMMESFNQERSYVYTTTGAGNLSYENQSLHLRTGLAPNSVFVTIPFEEVLAQSFTISQTVTVRSTAFSNILFIYGDNSNASTHIGVAIAVENGILRYHDGAWRTVPGYDAVIDQTMELMVYVDIENKTVDLYIDGAFVISFGFRTPSLANNLTHLYLGSDKQNADFEIDNIIVQYIEHPELELLESSLTLDMDTTPNYTVEYTSNASVEITTESATGVSIDGDVLTFAEPGTYVFTVTASNGLNTTIETLTIEVTSALYMPIITIHEDVAAVDLTISGDYILNYDVDANPVADVVVSVDVETGYTLTGDTFVFDTEGTYVVTITATNDKGSVSGTVTITVSETGYEPVITLNQDTHSIDLAVENEVALDFSVDAIPLADITITVNVETGFVVADNVFEFTAPGTYEVTVTATNSFGTDTAIITIVVTDSRYAPTVTVTEETATVDLSVDNIYELDFNVDANPVADVVVSVDVETGFTLVDHTLTFSEVGTYVVTISATNIKGSDTIDIVITVEETAVESYEFAYEFDTLPLDMTHSGTGTSMVSDGLLVLQTGESNGRALYGGTFERVLQGTYAAETRVKITSPVFTNIMLLYSGSSNVLGIAVQEGTLRYQNGSTWFNSNISIPFDEFVTIKAVTTVGSGTFDLYVNDIKYSGLSLRTKGAAEASVNRFASHGIDNRIGQTMTVDYFRVYQLSPEIYMSETAHTVVLTIDNTLTLDFDFGKGLPTTYDITADITTGWSLVDQTLIFNEAGLYVFTLTAETAFGTSSLDFEVDVLFGDTDPEITVNTSSATIDLAGADNTYTLDFTTNVTNPLSTLTIEVDQLDGFERIEQTLSFSKVGVYVVTLTYENENSTATDVITITVVETMAETNEFAFEFDTLPENMTIANTGTATVSEGMLILETGATNGRALYAGTFDRALQGTYAAETRVKITSPVFTNLILLYAGSSNVLGITVQDGTIRYQNGSTWYNSNIAVPFNEFFTIKAVTTVGSGTFDLYVDGVKYSGLSLRTKGTAEANVTSFASQGIDNRIGQTMTVDYFRVYQLSPELYTAPTNVITLNVDNTLNLEVGKGLPTNIALSADVETGWTFENRTITFTAEGFYNFTAILDTVYGSSTKNFEVEVLLGDTFPEITANETNPTVDLSGATHRYDLDFTTNVTSPESTLSISVDQLEGYVIDGHSIWFTEVGVYEVTLSYENTNGVDTDIITVNVIKSAFTNTILHDTFEVTGDLNNYTLSTSGTGAIAITDDVTGVDGGALSITTGETSGSAFIEMPFGVQLSGTVVAESRIQVGSTSFSNVMFFYASGTAIVAPLAFDSGHVRYHDGSWKATGFEYSIDTWYVVKMVVDVTGQTYDLYIDNVKIGTYGFRTPASSNDMVRFRNGSDKVNSAIFYDYIAVYNV